MIRKLKNLFATILLLIACLSTTVLATQKQKKKPKETETIIATGAQDREYWSNLLYKIASPVIFNLAQSTLKTN